MGAANRKEAAPHEEVVLDPLAAPDMASLKVAQAKRRSEVLAGWDFSMVG